MERSVEVLAIILFGVLGLSHILSENTGLVEATFQGKSVGS
jgi:hypothetical protein